MCTPTAAAANRQGWVLWIEGARVARAMTSGSCSAGVRSLVSSGLGVRGASGRPAREPANRDRPVSRLTGPGRQPAPDGVDGTRERQPGQPGAAEEAGVRGVVAGAQLT